MLKEAGENLGMNALNMVGSLDPTGISGRGLNMLQQSIVKNREEEDQRFDAEIERIEKQIRAQIAQARAKSPQAKVTAKKMASGKEKR